MDGATLRIGHGRAPVAALAFALALFQTSCVVLPVRIAQGIEGVVVDAVSGGSVADALVVVRFDGRHGDVLPDRQVLGYREARTDAGGAFRVGSLVRPGVSAWPFFKTDARVVAVLKEGYRCARPVSIRTEGVVKIPLQPALDDDDQRDSCRPVSANPGEAESYMTAWRTLFPEKQEAEDAESERQIVRILEARSVLGFGENCEGPVVDLALAPDGLRAAYVALSERPEVHIVELAPDGSLASELVAQDESSPPRRLAWTSAGDLVLWEPSADTHRSVSPSIFGSDRFEVVWKPAQRRVQPPAAPSFRAQRVKTDSRPQHSPLDPSDLNDEADTRWLGRSFSLNRRLDPATGLAKDLLAVVREDGSRYEVSLPGEACGPHGRFGRPQYRITAAENAGVDLRFVDGACRAVLIDLETGAWAQLDERSEPASCNTAPDVAVMLAPEHVYTIGTPPGDALGIQLDPSLLREAIDEVAMGRTRHVALRSIEIPLSGVESTSFASLVRQHRAALSIEHRGHAGKVVRDVERQMAYWLAGRIVQLHGPATRVSGQSPGGGAGRVLDPRARLGADHGPQVERSCRRWSAGPAEGMPGSVGPDATRTGRLASSRTGPPPARSARSDPHGYRGGCPGRLHASRPICGAIPEGLR